LEAEAAKHWSELMGQIPWNLKRHSDLVSKRQFNRLWELLIKWYDIGNNHGKATAAQIDAYRQHVREFGQIWVDQFTLGGVTPYVHIICKHSGAYLQQLGSFRPWSQESFEAAHKRNKRYYMKTNLGGGERTGMQAVHTCKCCRNCSASRSWRCKWQHKKWTRHGRRQSI